MLSYNGAIWKVTGTRDKLHGIWREAAVESGTSPAWFIWSLVLLVVLTQLLLCLVTHLYLAHEILEWWKVHILVLWLQDHSRLHWKASRVCCMRILLTSQMLQACDAVLGSAPCCKYSSKVTPRRAVSPLQVRTSALPLHPSSAHAGLQWSSSQAGN